MKSTFSITALLITLIFCSCNCNKVQNDKGDNEQAHKTEMAGFSGKSAIDVQVNSTTTGNKLIGMGVELDPHFLSQNVTRSDGAMKQDWKRVICKRVKGMNIQRYRIMVQPQWWEPDNENEDAKVLDMNKFTWDSIEMESLYAVLDLAEEEGAECVLVLWGCPIGFGLVKQNANGAYVSENHGRHFLCDDGSNWVTGTNNYEEFAENFTALVKQLIEVKGYTCVKEITPYNEPDGNVSAIEQYVPTAKALDARLKKEGLRDKIKLNLSDNTDSRVVFLNACASQLASEADLFNSHTYIFGYNTPNSKVLAWEKKNVDIAASAGKTHLVGEFGSNECVGASRQKDIDRYERGVLMTRHVINFLNAGAVGASYWSLIDQYYNRTASYQEMQQLGLWRYMENVYHGDDYDKSMNGDYVVRPQYFSYSLLTRYIRKGALVHPLDLQNDFAAGTALENENGKWTYVFANNTDSKIDVRLKGENVDNTAACDVFVYQEDALPKDDSQIESLYSLSPNGGTYSISIAPHSTLILNQQ